ncbi:MAG: 1-(5-phosphoribosyl)-5-((5-phosphoribosylamino)methylideneamino)imidazole-4-carboxamide isomerase, partial [Clostridia bacterium]|nr:1-(5-phosphoribosyl)-5-((5-phosphoribosylamino)methylideneamino)imidazole-4-carboxamide isomerase [Clostridia bacterium]
AIYTDISKDGMLSGTNLEIYNVLCQTYYPKITASGGITNEIEIEKLKNMGIYGAILGKALYENRIDLKKAIAIAEEK